MNKEENIEEPNIIEKPAFKTLNEMKEELGNKFDEYMYKSNIEFLNQIYEMYEENKQLKEEINKHKNILKEIEKNITKIKIDIEPWTIYKVDGEILFNIQLEIDKFKKLENGDSNE